MKTILNKCPCITGYYGSGVKLCVQCIETCENCSHYATNCSSCYSFDDHRVISSNNSDNYSCVCETRFYDIFNTSGDNTEC